MRRYAFILLLALSMAVLPLIGSAQNDSSAGSTTGSDAATSCARIQMGAVTGEEESIEETGETTDDEALQEYYNYQESTGGEEQTTEYSCNEQLNEDGTLTCFCGETPIVCTVEGEDVYCPECQNAQ